MENLAKELLKRSDDFGIDNGPRSTPAISQGILVTHSPQGLVHALDIKTGVLKWTRNLFRDFGSAKGFFGRLWASFILWIRNLFSF